MFNDNQLAEQLYLRRELEQEAKNVGYNRYTIRHWTCQYNFGRNHVDNVWGLMKKWKMAKSGVPQFTHVTMQPTTIQVAR